MYDVEFNPTDLNERISKISKIILDGTIDTINNYDHLLIIPSGGLCKFPFELLKDGESYLIEKKFITYLNSSIELTRVAKENNRKIKLSPSVIVSDPDYDLNLNKKAIAQSPKRSIKINEELTHEFTKTTILRSGINFRDKAFKRLPYTKLEGETYKIIFKGKAINLERQSATELNVNKLQSPEILHFATHAYYLKDTRTIRATHPFNITGLALAGANVLPYSSNRNFSNDGILTGSEVCALTLTGTKIVILSACETSVGDYLESEGLFSLSKAFRIAGAQSVLATHWPVSDKASARFTSQFLINLSEGLSPKEAIRKVKLNFINSGIPYNNPFFWGAFTLSGNWKN
jgi:CHAT domain-containing protein